MKHARIRIEPTDLGYLPCIACGKLHPHVDFAIVVTGSEPQCGIHKSCIELVHQKRGGAE